ncbi:unnamed protein product, partial [Iphiclides podalirius]
MSPSQWWINSGTGGKVFAVRSNARLCETVTSFSMESETCVGVGRPPSAAFVRQRAAERGTGQSEARALRARPP